MATFAGWITACIPHYRCHRFIRRSVESLLDQSYPWIRVIVINDGDPSPPWKELASLRDPRLLCFSLSRNRGPYFCAEIARRATPDPYFLIQDADDWSAPDRSASLLETLHSERAEFAVSAQPQFREAPDGATYPIGLHWSSVCNGEGPMDLAIDPHVTSRFRYRAPHHGLFRMGALRDIGGYYGGFHIAWDTLLTNLVLMTGSIGWTPEPLYYRFVRGDSLTFSAHTGVRSGYAGAVSQCIEQLYQECFSRFRAFRRQEISRPALCQAIQHICSRYVTEEDRLHLAASASELRRRMSNPQ
jgi:glycosyltransferase involved in cell wall biosynthesis